EKNSIMAAFVAHKLDILVSTTVIEVGVDVPNATVMMIEGAERFGLAQIHQLRGRVGRGMYQAYCYLMMSDSKAPSRRLRALESSTDGFKLAELDLELRGPGAIYGTMQHGQLDLRVAKLSDTKLIADARSAAQNCIDRGLDLLQYPYLYDRVTTLRAVTNLN
ncbi:MAG TPA: helicase-related protein, partial [Candidatus Limnocylindrales bacterium]|nr:helicase-related protein [Candidatus Limnocylindrales bacterium]